MAAIVISDASPLAVVVTETPIVQGLAGGWLRVSSVDTSEPALPDFDEGEAAQERSGGF